MPVPPPAAAEQLGQRQRPDVLLHVDRAVEVGPQQVQQRHVVEVGQQVVAGDPAPRQVQPPRRRDADGEQPAVAAQRGGLLHRVDHDPQHRLRRQAGAEADLVLRHDLAGEVDQHGADPQRLEVHAQEAAVGGVEPDRHRRAAPPRPAAVVLGQHALAQEVVNVVADRRRVDVEPTRQVQPRAAGLAEDQVEDPVAVGGPLRLAGPMPREGAHPFGSSGGARGLGLEAGPGPGGSLVRSTAPRSDQYESELMTSPLARVPSAHQMFMLIVLFTNRTLPSAIIVLTPPGCMLLALANVASLG